MTGRGEVRTCKLCTGEGEKVCRCNPPPVRRYIGSPIYQGLDPKHKRDDVSIRVFVEGDLIGIRDQTFGTVKELFFDTDDAGALIAGLQEAISKLSADVCHLHQTELTVCGCQS